MIPELREPIWYGNEASYEAACALEARVAGQELKAGIFDDIPGDYLLQKQGSVGVISIKGPLINADNPILAFFGVATYPAIRRALVSAAKDADIKQIMLDIDSGGGAVSGVADTADLIATINSKVKPVTTFAGGTMASAAYWLGVSGGKRFASKTSEVGSIGVLTVHMDHSKELEKEGIKATVIRSGKFKALENPFEPLSETAREAIQARIDAAYQVFGDHVAKNLGMSFTEMDRKVGQGRVFFGAQAKDAGLVDDITTFDAVFSKASSAASVDKRRAVYDNGINGAEMNKKTPLTEQDIAAIASGANLGAQAGEVELTEAQKAAKVEADKVAAAAAELAAKTEADKLAADKAAADAAAAKEPKDESALVSFLREELKAAQEKLTQGAVDKKGLEDKVATVGATHEALLAIARNSVAKLRIALGGSEGNAQSLNALEVVAEHKSLAENFEKKFKVGPLAASGAAGANSKQGETAVPPLHAAQVAATRIQ
jgi:signal peptide peptidase SppA